MNPEGRIVSSLRIFGTFLLVAFSWIFFRASTIQDSFTAISKLFSDWQFNLDFFKTTWMNLELSWPIVIYSILGIALMLTLERLKEIDAVSSCVYKYKSLRFACYLVLGWCVVYSWIFLQAADVGSSFIYFQF